MGHSLRWVDLCGGSTVIPCGGWVAGGWPRWIAPVAGPGGAGVGGVGYPQGYPQPNGRSSNTRASALSTGLSTGDSHWFGRKWTVIVAPIGRPVQTATIASTR